MCNVSSCGLGLDPGREGDDFVGRVSMSARRKRDVSICPYQAREIARGIERIRFSEKPSVGVGTEVHWDEARHFGQSGKFLRKHDPVRRLRRQSAHRAERGQDILMKASEAGNGIAGEGEDRLAAWTHAKPERFARPLGDAMKYGGHTQRRQRGRNVVVTSLGDTSGDDQRITRRQQTTESVRNFRRDIA